MLPNNIASTTPVSGAFSGARASSNITFRNDYEDGGVNLQDISLGLYYQTWRGWIETNQIYLSAANVLPTLMLTGSVLTEVSFSFDQSMTPVIAFVENGISKLYWFDATVSSMVITELPSTVKNPRVSLDTKHPLQTAQSDVILGYVRNNNLYHRRQRDRYEIEYPITTSSTVNTLHKIGMNVLNRFQFAYT